MGRKCEMPSLVAGIRASEEARERTKVMLLTLAGQWTVQDGCERLRIGRTRFQDLRREMLVAAVAVFERGAPGRPGRRPKAAPGRIRALEQELDALQRRNRCLRTQLELEQLGLGDAIRSRLAYVGGA